MRLSCEILCPECSGRATFHEPFEFHSGKKWVADGRPEHRWGGWIVVEKFPGTLSWVGKKTTRHCLETGPGVSSDYGYRILDFGVSLCSICYATKKHQLNWPSDAYWNFTVRGQTLWSWDRTHAETIRQLIAMKLRPVRRSPELRYIPSHFFLAKNRKTLLRKMDELLER